MDKYGLILATINFNTLHAPVRVFKSFNEGKKFLDELFKIGIERKHIKVTEEKDKIVYKINHLGYDEDELYNFNDLTDVLFISYYGGCGEANEYILLNATFGEKITSFDLD